MTLVTLDTGALIAIERRKPRGVMLLRAARERGVRLLAITPVVAEWWRGPSDVREQIASAVALVPFRVRAARAAGVVLAKLRGDVSLAVDVMVMAYAATFGGAVVYRSDVGDLQAIGRFFPAVRVLGV